MAEITWGNVFDPPPLNLKLANEGGLNVTSLR